MVALEKSRLEKTISRCGPKHPHRQKMGFVDPNCGHCQRSHNFKTPLDRQAVRIYVQTMTEIVAYTNLRAKLSHFMNEVCSSRAPLYVTRQNAPTVVMVSAEEWDGMVETLHLLSSPANAARLLQSIANADIGKLTEHDLNNENSLD